MFRLFSLLFLVSCCFSWSQDELKAILTEHIKRKFGQEVKVSRIEFINWDDRLEGEPSVELDMNFGRGRALAYLNFQNRRITAVVYALWKAKFLIAKQDIQKGTLLSPELFDREERWLRSIPQDLTINPEELRNYQASTYIPKGSILRRSIMKPVPAVSRGDIVKLVFRSGSIEILSQGTSLDRAEVGGLVRVKTQSGKVLRGRVVERGVVEVLE